MKNSLILVVLAVAAAILTSWTPGAIGAAVIVAFVALAAVAMMVVSIGAAALSPAAREPDLPAA
jgi:hypothetical protein